jgi:hypothetical protein
MQPMKPRKTMLVRFESKLHTSDNGQEELVKAAVSEWQDNACKRQLMCNQGIFFSVPGLAA